MLGSILFGFWFRAILLVGIFVFLRVSWSEYLTTSDASSFLPVAHTIAGTPSPGGPATLYDTRVFPGWPLMLAPALWLGLPEQTALALSLGCTALASWLYHRLTRDLVGTWLLAVFPPAWVLATVHPISEGAYFCLAVAGCLAVRARAWFWVGLAGGCLVFLRPFGLAWVLAYAIALHGESKSTRSIASFLLGGALMAVTLIATNLTLYGDVLHQIRVYARPLSELNVQVAPTNGGEASGHWGWPFFHLLVTPFRYAVPVRKLIYVWATVAGFGVVAGAAIRQLSHETELPAWRRAVLLGFVLNCVFSFCTGPYWAFHSIDRYFVWGLPGALVAAQPFWQKWPRLPWALAAVSAGLSVCSLWNRFSAVTVVP